MIVFERLHADTPLPERATEGSAGYDLRAYLVGRTVTCSDFSRQWDEATTVEAGGATAFVLAPGVCALVPLGFRARLPRGIEAQIRPRSGTSFKSALRIPNAPGTVDSDFPDEWRVIVQNCGTTPIRIGHGDRIAQMVLAKHEVLAIVEGTVKTTTDRVGGFGSTG